MLVGGCLYRVCGPIMEVLAIASVLPTNWTPAKSVLAVDWVKIPEARNPYSGIPYLRSYTASEGCIWVLQTHYVERGSGSTNPNLIVRVDMDGTRVESPVLQGDIDEICYAHGRLWVLNADTSPCVWSLHPNSMTILDTIPLPAHLQALDSYGQLPEWFLQLRLHQNTIYLCANLRQDSPQYKDAEHLTAELWSLDAEALIWSRQMSLAVEEPTSDQA